MYGPARQSYLQMLDPVHNQGLRLCLGAFRTSVERPCMLMHMNLVWVLDVQSYLCSMLPRSGHCLNIPHMTQCLITNI